MTKGYPDDNPKTAVGVSKAPLHFIPPVSLVHLGLAMEDGGSKYGMMNWREHTVSSSVYYDAMLRHLMAYWDGENVAPDSRIHHLGHVMACAAILLDAEENEKLNDDRPKFTGRVNELLDRVRRVREAILKGADLTGLARHESLPPKNNDQLKNHNRTNMPKPGAPLMRKGLRIIGSALYFEDTVLLADIEDALQPSDADRLRALVDGIEGDPQPVRWHDANTPEG